MNAERKDVRMLLAGEIDTTTVSPLIDKILQTNLLDDENQKELKDYERRPILLYICSNGGSVYDALGLIDVMQSSRTPIYTICVGQAMSAALWVYCAGKQRYIGKNATLMFHDVSFGVYDKAEGVKEQLLEVNRLREMCIKSIISVSKIKESVLRNALEKKIDLYWSAEDAVKYKMAKFYEGDDLLL